MPTPYGIEVQEQCVTCQLRYDRLFCNLPEESLKRFDEMKFTSVYPTGAVLFVEGQTPRGVYIICGGKVKLSASSADGKKLILKVAEPGEVLGLSAAISGKNYDVTAETVEPCQVNFIRREEFLNFLNDHTEACFHAARQLSEDYHTASEEVRSLGLSTSVAEKLAKLILGWAERSGKETKEGVRVSINVTHEEIAQMIGTSRETVTRLLSDFKKRELIHLKGTNMTILKRGELEDLVTT